MRKALVNRAVRYCSHVTEWALLLVGTTFLHDDLLLSWHWVPKDLGMFLGTLFMLTAALSA